MQNERRLPTPRPRPAFALWRYERNLTLRATADLLEQSAGFRICSHETVRVICLPFGDPGRMVPDSALQDAIEALTEAKVRGQDWAEPVSVAA